MPAIHQGPSYDGASPKVTRRRVVAGAAWAAPAVAFAAAAPALASSMCTQSGSRTVRPADGVVELTIPTYCNWLQYTIRGGDGGFFGGGGAFNSGVLRRSNPNAGPLTVTLIAGDKGDYVNPQYGGTHNTGGTGYGKGGDTSWIPYPSLYTGGMHSSAGAGGGGSAILLGTAAANTPLVVAGGGGGGSHHWAKLGSALSPTWTGSVNGGSAGAPGPAGNATAAPSFVVYASSTRYYGRTDGTPSMGANGATGGAAAVPGPITADPQANGNNAYLFTATGAAGGNHGTGLNGGGDGGAGNGPGPTDIPSWASGQQYTAGGSGGGGYAGGGGGLSLAGVRSTPLAFGMGSMGSAGAAGSSFVSGALVAPSGETVTPLPDAWSSGAVQDYFAVPGYVTISWG